MEFIKTLGLVAALLVGCGGSDKPLPPMELATVSPDMSHPAGLCSDPRADVYTPPISQMSQNGLFKIALMSSTPAPPQATSNSWDLTIADASGNPVPGATISVKPWMPDHGHGTSVNAKATPGASAGEYTVAPLYLFMSGLWTVTFTIEAPSSTTSDTVVFSFCISDGGF